MFRGSIIWVLTELCLLLLGALIAPFWMQEHLLIVFVLSAALLMVFLCYENWPKMLQFSRDRQWADLEAGGRYYRDLLSGYGRDRDMRIFDTMSSPHPDQPTASPVANAFRFIVEVAVNEGKMEVWGVPENGSTPERLLKIDDDVTAYQKSLSSGEFFFTMNGVNYRNLRIKRSSIKSYVDHVRRRGTERSAALEGKTDDLVKAEQSSPERRL